MRVHCGRSYIHLFLSCCRLCAIVLTGRLCLIRMMVLLAYRHRSQYQSQHCGCDQWNLPHVGPSLTTLYALLNTSGKQKFC